MFSPGRNANRTITSRPHPRHSESRLYEERSPAPDALHVKRLRVHRLQFDHAGVPLDFCPAPLRQLPDCAVGNRPERNAAARRLPPHLLPRRLRVRQPREARLPVPEGSRQLPARGNAEQDSLPSEPGPLLDLGHWQLGKADRGSLNRAGGILDARHLQVNPKHPGQILSRRHIKPSRCAGVPPRRATRRHRRRR